MSTNRLLLAIVTILASAGALAAVVLLSGADSPPRERDALGPAEAHRVPAAVRTVVVFAGSEPSPSTPGGPLRVQRLRGRMPQRSTLAVVETDEDCEPDAANVSHCLNRLRLPDGRPMTVRHPHEMSRIPCLTPGERVRVVPEKRS